VCKFWALDTIPTEPGWPPLPSRLIAALAGLKRTLNLSDEVVCDRWIANPLSQYFCGEE
jgi:transposase, IS5 family